MLDCTDASQYPAADRNDLIPCQTSARFLSEDVEPATADVPFRYHAGLIRTAAAAAEI